MRHGTMKLKLIEGRCWGRCRTDPGPTRRWQNHTAHNLLNNLLFFF